MPAPGADPLATPYLDPATIARVVAMEDVLARNAAITRGYHDLALATAAILGRDHANWLTFGQWASAEARRSIDGAAVPAAIRPFVGDDVAAAVAAGNAAIFADVAPPFIRFVREMRSIPRAPLTRRSQAAFVRLAAHPQLAGSEDLTSAFRAYGGRPPAAALLGEEGGRRASLTVSPPTPRLVHTSSALPTRSCERRSPGAGSPRSRPRCTWGSASPRASWSSRGTCRRPTYLGGAMFPPGLESSRIQMRSRWRSASARIPDLGVAQ